MKILIVGGVAGGATAAARARRISESAEIAIVERGPNVSYANCGLPYFLSRDIQRRSRLLLQTPEGFESRYRVKVLVESEAVEIDRAGKRVRIRAAEGESWLPYDALILAQGGSPIVPPVEGADSPNVFRLWTVPDMDRLHQYIEDSHPRSAVIVGGGFIGIEAAEAFRKRELQTTLVEMLPRVMATMDQEFGNMIAGKLEANGVAVRTSVKVRKIRHGTREIELSDGSSLPADLVLFSAGVRPELALAKAAGLAIGSAGGLVVDEHLRTSDPDIFAAGDMLEIVHKISGRKMRIPLAGPANRQGRIAASNALGMEMRYSGALGTNVIKIFDATAASTGLTENAAREAGFDVGVAVVHRGSHASYYPGAAELTLKLVFDRSSGRLLGGQAFGEKGVDKRIDVVATALQGRMTLADLAEVDLAYAPPYSSANDSVNMAAFVGLNHMSGFSPVETAGELKNAMALDSESGGAAEIAAGRRVFVLDVRNLGEYEASHLARSTNIPVDELRDRLDEVPRDHRIHVLCRVGFRGHLAVRILKAAGYSDVVNVTGGFLSVLAEGGFDTVVS
jgi:NADPH-dependent 2,4-dienoyl-CoA reductase/sulfur reductase-like enzyme/rhodanese-related sulfurtransferase